jgi:leucyl/phenylalanyl-tRNA--protein transferase
MPVFALPDQPVFPDPEHADEDGLLAIGGDLSPQRLLMAYAEGIFPWYTENAPILWWSPDPRLILEPSGIHVPRRLERILRQGRFRFTLDTAFEQVITNCAETPRDGAHGTWIVPEMHAAYCRLHRLGYAHSIEAWEDGELAGGLYGVALGGAFFGESMFFHRPDASKAALVTLVRALDRAGFTLIDCQQTTAHMIRFGGFEVSRKNFLTRLRLALELPFLRGHWALVDGALECRLPDKHGEPQ